MEDFYYGPEGQEFLPTKYSGVEFGYGPKRQDDLPTIVGDGELDFSYGPEGQEFLPTPKGDVENGELIKFRGTRRTTPMESVPTQSSGMTLPEKSIDLADHWILRLFGNRRPLAFEAGDDNLYRYVHNQPTEATDPSGLRPRLRRRFVQQSQCQVAPLLDWSQAVEGARRDEQARAGHLWAIPLRGGGTINAWRPDNGDVDATGYWCHGFTFGGSNAPGGPFSIFGNDVPLLLQRGYARIPEACAAPGDIMVWTLGPPGTAIDPVALAAALFGGSAAIGGPLSSVAGLSISSDTVIHSAVLTRVRVANGLLDRAHTMLNTKNGSLPFQNMSLEAICFGLIGTSFTGYRTNYLVYRARQ